MNKETHTSITVMGAGESGTGAAILAKKQGYQVWVSDKHRIKPYYREILEAHQIPYEEGKHTTEQFFEANYIIKSPGIPGSVPLLQEAKSQGVPVISEIEFAARHTQANLIAITGSNGKTTTTSLIYHLLKGAGWDVGIGGNIGKSFAWQLVAHTHDWYVLEVSSFQLDDIISFHPSIALLLNITEDHLDRYNYDLDAYAQSKFNITANQNDTDTLIYFSEDPNIERHRISRTIAAQQIPYGQYDDGINKAWVDKHQLMFENGTAFTFDTMQLKGIHNQLNTIAALLAVDAAGVDIGSLQYALDTFEAVRHRLQYVGSYRDIAFINDSKATNVDATCYALESMDKPVIWIAGGIDKGNDYTAIETYVSEKVHAMIVLGEGMEKLDKAFPTLPKWQAWSMEEVITLSVDHGRPGDCVLLSPACASFDLFKNYEDRGDQFIDHVTTRIETDQHISKQNR